MIGDQISHLYRFKKLRQEVSTDYLGVKRYIDDMREGRKHVGLHTLAVDYPKPYTILASYLSRRIGVPDEPRIAACTVTEQIIKPIMLADDFLDENWDGIQKQTLDWSSNVRFDDTELDKTNFEYLRLLPLFNNINGIMLLDEHERLGIAKPGSADALNKMNDQVADKVLKSYSWQLEHRIKKREGILNKKDFPSVDELIETYVSGIAGAPFSLVPEIVSYYTEDPRAKEIVPLMYYFGEIFQIPDDTADIHEDIIRLQMTTAISAILNHGTKSERELLYSLSTTPVGDGSQYVYKKFPSLKALEPRMSESRLRLKEGLVKLGLTEVVKDFEIFDENYEQIRRMINSSINR
ncbi:hypothetical protein EPN87_01025 [archaeon]|nr:MAG: hypothetical protein EPN87_01025 [archaeon]